MDRPAGEWRGIFHLPSWPCSVGTFPATHDACDYCWFSKLSGYTFLLRVLEYGNKSVYCQAACPCFFYVCTVCLHACVFMCVLCVRMCFVCVCVCVRMCVCVREREREPLVGIHTRTLIILGALNVLLCQAVVGKSRLSLSLSLSLSLPPPQPPPPPLLSLSLSSIACVCERERERKSCWLAFIPAHASSMALFMYYSCVRL